MPERIQLRRTKGWRLPPNTVVVSRPSKWGNPFAVGDDLFGNPEWHHVRDRADAVRLFRSVGQGAALEDDALAELRGKDLACWCPLEDENGNRVPCHADVLLEWANAEVPE